MNNWLMTVPVISTLHAPGPEALAQVAKSIGASDDFWHTVEKPLKQIDVSDLVLPSSMFYWAPEHY